MGFHKLFTEGGFFKLESEDRILKLLYYDGDQTNCAIGVLPKNHLPMYTGKVLCCWEEKGTLRQDWFKGDQLVRITLK